MDMYVLYADENTVRDREVTLNSIKVGHVNSLYIYVTFNLYTNDFLKLLSFKWKKVDEVDNEIISKLYCKGSLCFPSITYSISLVGAENNGENKMDICTIDIYDVNFGTYELLDTHDSHQRDKCIEVINAMLKQLGVINEPLPKDGFEDKFEEVKSNIMSKISSELSNIISNKYGLPLSEKTIQDNNIALLCITPMKLIVVEKISKDLHEVEIQNTGYKPSIWIKKDLFEVMKYPILNTLKNPKLLPSYVMVNRSNTKLNVCEELIPSLSDIFGLEYEPSNTIVLKKLEELSGNKTLSSNLYVEDKHTKSKQQINNKEYVIYEPIDKKP